MSSSGQAFGEGLPPTAADDLLQRGGLTVVLLD